MDIFPQVLISGASGMVGSALRNHLVSEAISYATLTRDTAQPGSSRQFWDPYNFHFLEEMRRFSGIRAAIHLSGESLSEGRWTAAKKRRIRESRIRTTEAVVNLLSHLDRRPEVLICASAIGYYGDSGEEILTESSPPGNGFLPDVCREWEAAADAAATLGIRVVILRFGVILAAEGGALAKMLPLFRLGAGGNLGDGRQWMSWISLVDVVRIIDFCLKSQQVHGPINAVSPMPTTNAEFTRTLAAELRRPAIIPAPAFALRLIFGEMADAALLASTRAIPQRLQHSGFAFHHSTLVQALQTALPV